MLHRGAAAILVCATALVCPALQYQPALRYQPALQYQPALGPPGAAATADVDTPVAPTGSGAASSPSTIGTPTALAADPVTGRAPLMIVLDASGSMNLEDAPGKRMDLAQRAVTSLIRGLPADARVGLTVYGTHTGANTSEKSLGCTDVTVLQPVRPLDADSLSTSVDAVVASGFSPIGEALRVASAALPQTGRRTILLVSDGYDYCTPPDPCGTAQGLAASEPGLTIHTLGVHVDDAAQQQLRCIASATGGEYVDAEKLEDSTVEQDVVDWLAAGYQRDTMPYRASGTAITGSAEPSADTPLMTPGNYLDNSLTRGTYYGSGSEKGGTVRYYRLALGTRMTPWVSATIVGDQRTQDYAQAGIQLTLVNGSDDQCLPKVESSESAGGSDPLPVVSAQLGGILPNTGTWSKECPAGAPVFLRVERLGGYRFGLPLPVELQLRAEPPVEAAESLQPASIQGERKPPMAGPATPTAGGTSFADAPTLQPGSTITDTIVAGETRFYAVPLSWGQRLSYRVLPTGVGTPASASVEYARVDVANPMRATVAANQQQQGAGFAARKDFTGLTGDSVVPVLYGNRVSTDEKVRGYAFAGRYYLQLSLSPSQDDPRLTIPFALTVDAAGAAPAPKYLAGNASAETRDPATPSVTTAAPASGSAGGQFASAETPRWLWAVAGAAAALLMASGLALLRRRPRGNVHRR